MLKKLYIYIYGQLFFIYWQRIIPYSLIIKNVNINFL